MRLRIKGLFLLIILSSILQSSFASYPRQKDNYINDLAFVIDRNDERKISKVLRKLKSQKKVEVVAVIINSFKQYHTGSKTFEAFATGLFNHWKIGDAQTNKGVLLLISIKDRKCRIELGGGYGRDFDEAMKSVIQKTIVPSLKKKQYFTAIYNGSKAIVIEVNAKTSFIRTYQKEIGIGFLVLFFGFALLSCIKSGKDGWGWAIFYSIGMLLVFFLRPRRRGYRSSYGSSSSFGGGGGGGGGSSFGGGASGGW